PCRTIPSRSRRTRARHGPWHGSAERQRPFPGGGWPGRTPAYGGGAGPDRSLCRPLAGRGGGLPAAWRPRELWLLERYLARGSRWQAWPSRPVAGRRPPAGAAWRRSSKALATRTAPLPAT